MRPQLAEVETALAVLLELERRLHQHAGAALGLDLLARQRLAVVLVEHRLGIEAVDLRHATVHEQKDDLPGPGREVGAAAGDGAAGARMQSAGLEQRLLDHVGKGQHAEAGSHSTQSFTSRDRLPGLEFVHGESPCCLGRDAEGPSAEESELVGADQGPGVAHPGGLGTFVTGIGVVFGRIAVVGGRLLARGRCPSSTSCARRRCERFSGS